MARRESASAEIIGGTACGMITWTEVCHAVSLPGLAASHWPLGILSMPVR
jgi:hypothetical protein